MIENTREVYNDAKSKGKREYHARKARGLSGHLTSLDGLIKDVEIISTLDIGVQELPLKKVVGTNSNFRRNVFSKSFLPLEKDDTEFAMKWMALCKAHLEEGIRDPIKVFEYMNYYYAIEGNKRVSVLKYYDAISIHGKVLRLLPRYDEEDPDIRLYYRFLEFNKTSNLNQIWLSNEDDYDDLLKILSKFQPESDFYDDKYQHFYYQVYVPFRRIYKAAGGDKLNITTGDAFLLYAKIYDIPETLDTDETKEVMPNLLTELFNLSLEGRDIKTDAEEFEKTSIVETISSIIPKKLKIAFIYAKNVEESGWTRSHELGRIEAENYFDAILTESFENIQDEETLKSLIDTLAEEKFDVVFTTAMIHRKATLSAALKYDKIKFFNCSGARPYIHMSSYYGRSYETRFLTGIIAGAMTRSNILGYTAANETPESISCINAFTLGARMVNPNVQVKVCFTGVWNSPESNILKIEKMMALGADLISSKNNVLSRESTNKYGITSMLCSVDGTTHQLNQYLAAPIWKWDVFYKKIISSLINGAYTRITRDNQGKKLINFWWGLESGGIDVFMNDEAIPTETKKLVNFMKRAIISDEFKPFTGPILDQAGQMRLQEDELLSAEDIIEMDWYVKNVEILEL